ncbi:TetR family transcriptional regulator [Pseudarthrobacter phenanthrenivorans]|uniref:TetR family transcriptional regulator n=1 Tax=Pseudarthrobacter phenanthrenivorans TaxID=361575 RepID=UPI00344D028A
MIVPTAVRLSGNGGYRAVTVRDVAAEAGLSASPVIRLSLSKIELYAACSLKSRCSPS